MEKKIVDGVEVEFEEEKNEDEAFINSLLEIDEEQKVIDKNEKIDKTPEELEKEAELLKNKNAEEKRKRLEKEAKDKKDAEAKTKAEEALKLKEAKEKDEADALAKTEKEKVVSANKKKQDKLGGQLKEFKEKYPDVDFKELDKDKNFKKFYEGKLLGKKDFTILYEEYVEMRIDMSGEDKEAIAKNYRKSQSSSGTGGANNVTTPTDIYSESEMNNVAQKLAFMSPEEAAKVEAKLDRSIAYFDKK